MQGTQYLAFLDGDAIWILIPLTALMIPIVAILIAHQQKMAAIIHGKPSNSSELMDEVKALRGQVDHLTAMMSYQAAALDRLSGSQTALPPVQMPISERLQC